LISVGDEGGKKNGEPTLTTSYAPAKEGKTKIKENPPTKSITKKKGGGRSSTASGLKRGKGRKGALSIFKRGEEKKKEKQNKKKKKKQPKKKKNKKRRRLSSVEVNEEKGERPIPSYAGKRGKGLNPTSRHLRRRKKGTRASTVRVGERGGRGEEFLSILPHPRPGQRGRGRGNATLPTTGEEGPFSSFPHLLRPGKKEESSRDEKRDNRFRAKKKGGGNVRGGKGGEEKVPFSGMKEKKDHAG